MGIPDAASEVDPAMPPMEARQVDRLPTKPGWQFEPKWDGFRCLLFRAGNRAELTGKSGKSLARFFPEIVALIERLEPANFALDGELIVEANGALSFDALQMRLHPAASRIKRLSSETPATVMLFDALAINGNTCCRRLLSTGERHWRASIAGMRRSHGSGCLPSLATYHSL